MTLRMGLVALSGTRVQDPELVRMGMTLPGFVERNRTIAALPSLGLLTLAGMTPPGVELAYHEVDDASDLEAIPDDYDAVAVSFLSARAPDAYRIADHFRRRGVTVIAGGLHVTARPFEAARHADAVVVGEGEPVWRPLIDDLLHDRLRPLYDARPAPFSLADAPLPRFDLLDPDRYNRIPIQTARGCPLDCAFCAASIRLRPGYRVKPVEKILAEIRYAKRIWPQPFLEFADDNSFIHRRHAKTFLRRLAEEKVRWFTEADLSIADDDELLALMRDAGCAQVLIGIESPNIATLDGIERRGNRKYVYAQRAMAAIDRIQRHGITVNGCFVLGLDGTDSAIFEQVLDFVQISGLYEVQVTVLTPFPGTPLYHRLQREGRLLQPEAWERCTLFDVNFRPDRMTVDELRSGFRWLASQLYSRETTHERRRRFLRRWWHLSQQRQTGRKLA